MSVDSEYMFSVPLFRSKVTPWEEIKQQIIKIVGNTCIADEKGFSSDYYNNNYNTELYQLLRPYVNRMTEQCLGITAPIQSPNMWSQRYSAGSEHPVHNHGNRGYSFILYVNFDPAQHRATQFISPFDNFYNGEMLVYSPEIQEGDMIAFPSIIKHSSQYQTGADERMIISFNLFENGR
tara:strand:+ start:393 stop:929 length:537 start_codon:yes stop_codon:yes gene_type:complete